LNGNREVQASLQPAGRPACTGELGPGAGDQPPVPPSSEAPQASATEGLAEQAQNPIANLISVPFQNNTTLGLGPDQDQTLNVLNIQPVVPFRLNDRLTLVTRTILPVLSQPVNASLQAYANLAKPDLFGDVTIRAQIQLLFPTR
jgi:hypothetical protein